MSGFPDIVLNIPASNARPRPLVSAVVETKAPERDTPTWTPKTIGYRPAQVIFRRKWAGPYILAAWCGASKSWAMLLPPKDLRMTSLLKPETRVYSDWEAAHWIRIHLVGGL